MKDVLNKIPYCLGSVLILVGEIVFPRVPVSLLSFIFDVVFFLAYPALLLVPPFRRVVLPNLDIAFGETMTGARKWRLGTRAMRRLFKMIPVCLYYGHPKNRAKIARDVTFVGREHIERALAHGRGIIALQAHFGNFVLMTMAFAQSELSYLVVTKEPNSQLLRDRYIKWKRISGVRWIDADMRARATKEILRGLADNQIVALVADERKKKDGIIVPFFGRPALTTPGPAVLSLRTGAPIVPTFIVQERRRRYRIEIGPPLSVEPTGDHTADVRRLTEEANRVIEDYIKRYPDQWAWTNARWRT